MKSVILILVLASVLVFPVSVPSTVTEQSDSVLCCWFCSVQRRMRCGQLDAEKCRSWGGHEVSSCSECAGF